MIEYQRNVRGEPPLDLIKLVPKYDLNIKGVIHVGANKGEDADIYHQLGVKAVYFEPRKEAFRELHKIAGHDAYNCALGNFNGATMMHIASNGQSSSLLEATGHLRQYPFIKFRGAELVDVRPLDSFTFDSYNVLVIDTEGYELEVLKGATRTLKHIDYIIAEVAREELRKDQPLVQDLDDYLKDFSRVETNWICGTWGDALYIRK